MNSKIFLLRLLSLCIVAGALVSVLSLWKPGTQMAAPLAAQEPAWPELTLVDTGFSFEQPMHLTRAHDGSGRIFVAERVGHIRIIQDGALRDTPLLDISDRVTTERECGLLSVAFPPNFSAVGHFYVYYSSNTNRIGADEGCDTVVARFPLTAPHRADPDQEEVVLLVDQPFSNHNGGQIAFGPDDYLYIGLGDGGDSNDPLNAGQRTDTLLGKMLRIDVDASAVATYTIPASNPFTQTVGYRPEIWALGLRNPWRFSFDRATGDLYIGDVGQWAYEEIDFQAAASGGGENYGWKIMEGFHCRPPTTDCDMTGLTLPVVEYPRDLGRSVTGGRVYRGATYPRMAGVYFYADFASGRIWGLRNNGSGWENQELLDTTLSPVSFGADEAGNLYILDIGGALYELTDTVVATATPSATATDTPSATATQTLMPTPSATSTPTQTTPVTATPAGTPPASATPDDGTAATPPPNGNASDVLYLPLIAR